MQLKSNFSKFALTSLTFFVALIAGCSSGTKTAPVTTSSSGKFLVASSSPAAGATQVATSATVVITFSGPADATTVNDTNIKVTSGNNNAVAGAVTYNATTYVATFTPSTPLAPNITYTVTVTGVTSSGGTTMASSFTSTFSTIASSPTYQYRASLFSWPNPTSINGQVSVDTAGNVTVQLTGATASKTFTAQFCPAYDAGAGASPPACLTIGSVSTDASGNGSSTTMFPKPGSWAGDFQVTVDAMMTGYMTGLQSSTTAATSGQIYMSTLQPETTANGTGVSRWTTQSPLTSGTVTYSNGSVEFAVTGATPNALYDTIESETVALDSSGSYAMGSLTTGSGGNGSTTASLAGGSGSGDMFQVDPASTSPYSAGYIGGFSVPPS